MISDLTLGIPLSSANPLLTILDGEEERRRKRAEWQAKAIDNLDQAVLDWDGFTRDKPQPPLNFAADPETAKKLGIVHSYLAIQSPTATAPEDPVTRGVFRDRIAQERFSGRGVGDDLAFYGEIEKEVTGRKDARLLMQDATSTAATAAILSAAGEAGTTYDQWITAARQRPGYRPDLEDVYFSEWRDRQRDLTEQMAPVRDLVARQWTAMKEGKTADLEGLEGLMADEDQRETLLLAIGGLVKALPKDQQPGVLANLRKQFLRRDLPLQAEGVMASMRPFDRDEPLPAEYLDQLEPGTNLEAFEKRKRAEFERDTQLRERFVRKLESIVFDQYDPVVTFAKEGSNWQALEKGLYAAPGVGLTIGTAMIPGAGNFISYEVLRKTSTDMARDSLVQGGFTEDQADEAAQGIGTVSALIQLPMERLGLAAVTNRLPFVKKAIGKLTSNLATRYLARAGSSTLIEFGTEMGQDLVPYIVQEMGNAAGLDMPGVQWTGQGGVFHNYDQKSLEVVGAILPLSLIMAGGGVINDRQIQQVAALDDVTLQAAGMSPDAVAAVRAANGIGEQELALRSAWESRDVNSETALAAQQELTARTQADQQIAAEATQAGAMPTFYRSADGWSVRDGESGTEIGTSTTADGALRLAMAHSSAIEEDNADQIAALATLLEAGDVVAGTDQEGVRQTATDLRPGQVVTAAQQAAQSEQDDIRIRQQTETRERLGGGDGGTARMVLGQSVTETRQKVRNTVNRINAGGSVLTVFHESNHGFFREALATGRLTRDETLQAIRAIETVLAGKTTKEGEQLAFLSDPETFASLSQEKQDAELDEAVAELMDAEILRTRKTGTRKSPGHKVPPGLITRNLTAMARLAPGATQKLRDFIAAVRAFWGLTFQRAAAIKSAIREGTLDETQLEAFKSKLFGLEDQTDLEQAARDTEARIIAGTEQAAELDGDPFSLGDYRIEHQPHPDNAQLSNLTEMFPDDIYGPNAIRYYGSGQEGEREAVAIFRRVRDKPDAPVTIYRVVPDFVDDINPGDWVTISKAAAEAMNTPDFIMVDQQGKPQQPKIITKDVTAGDVRWPGDSLLEQGYFPQGDVSFSIAASRESLVSRRPISPATSGEVSFSIGRAVQFAKQTEKSAKIAEEDFFTTFWPRMMKLAGQNLKASTRNINEAARRAVDDIGDWVKNNPKFQDYYNEDWKNTRAILDETFEGFTDDLFKGFRLFTGLTSPSTPLDGNLADAVQLINLWNTQGSLLSLTLRKSAKGNRSAGPGPFLLRSSTGATKIFSLHVVEGLFRKFGSWEKTVDFLNEPVSVKDLHAFNKEMGYSGSVGGIGNIRRVVMEATGQDEMIPRMFIFGPKVGAYTLNTLGDHRYTTTDIWESRFIRSYFPEMFKTSDGLPVNEDEHTIFQRFASAFNKQFEAHYGIKLENSALQAVRWFYMLAHAKEAGYRYARTNQTISGYTLQAVRTHLGSAPANRGRGSQGSGGAEQGQSFSLGRPLPQTAANIIALAKELDPVAFQSAMQDTKDYIQRRRDEGIPLGPVLEGDQVTLAAQGILTKHLDDPRAVAMLEGYGEDQFSSFSLGPAALASRFAPSLATISARLAEINKQWGNTPKFVFYRSQLQEVERQLRYIEANPPQDSYGRGLVDDFLAGILKNIPLIIDRLDGPMNDPDRLELIKTAGATAESITWNDGTTTVPASFDPMSQKFFTQSGELISNGDLMNSRGILEIDGREHSMATIEAISAEPSFIVPGNIVAGSFSLGPAALADLLGKDAISRIKDPVRRAQAMSRVAREMEAARLQFERLELVAGSKRLKKSLAREAAIRTALRQEELENEAWARHWQILSDDDLVKIKSQPAHKLLGDPHNPMRGRIQSRTATIARNPDLYTFKEPAEFNGSEGVSRSVFGGTLTPDLAVEELVQEGLLPPGSKPDAMWALLESEARSVSDRKRDLSIAKQELREARTQATDETNVWLREQGVIQETTFSDKQEILRALGVLDGILSSVPAEIRGKIGGYTQLARIATNEAKLAFLKDRLAKVDTELEKYLRDQFDREFRALLDKAKPEKDEAGKKPRGKIGADVHELFAAVREAMTMTGAEVEADAVALESLVASGDYTAAQESHMTLQANLIRLAGDWGKADAARREAALIEATSIYAAGYMAHKTQTLQKREKRQKVRDALQQATGMAGTREERRGRQQKDETTKAGRALTTLFSLMSFEQVVQRAFGEDTQEARDLVDWERHAAHAKADAVQNKLDQLDDLFTTLAGGKLKGEELRFAMSRPDAITVDGQTFSELEAITATLMWRQEDGKRHMTGHVDDQGAPAGDWNYTQTFIDQLEAKLSQNAKAVRLHLAQQYAAEYDRLNAVFRDLNGVSLPRHKAYSPLTVKPVQSAGGQMLDPVTGMAMSGAGFTPGSLKNRSQSAIAEPDFKDALQVYIGHSKQMEHWIAYAPFSTEAMAILNTRDIGNSVEAAAGKEALGVLRSWLDVFAQGGTRDAAAHLGLNKLLGRVTGRAAATALVGRVSVLAIQSTQLGAALAEMPTASYISRLARLFAGRLDWSGAIQSDYIQRRRAQMPPIVQQAMEGLTSSKPSRLKYVVRKMGETIAGADALFTAGTFAIVLDYQLQQAKALGLTGAQAKAFALESAERATDRVAQPVRPGTRSLYEVTAVNPLARISWAFASDARQKLALSAYALANKPPAAKARALAVTWLAGGVIATLIRAAMRDIRDDGDDDEIFDDKKWDPKRLALSALTGPLAGVPALGDALEGLAFAAFGEYLPEGNLISGLQTAGRAVKSVPDWFTGDREGWDTAIKDAEALMGGFGLVSDSAAAATSLLHVARDLFGIGQNLTD